jgi:tRNA U34 5-methylaminomethyl-2-thiouridine-forming methyltransferase MnmC
MSNQCGEDTHITEDGSLTLKDDRTGELYHNRAGAYTEALANFVEPLNLRALASQDRQLAFLDVCFGLGYNSFALLNELMKLDLQAESIKIVAIEKFEKPLLYIGRVLSDLRFQSLHRQIDAQAPQLRSGAFGRHTFSLPCESRLVRVDFELIEGDLRDLVPPMVAQIGSIFDGIFHDPFSPRRAPELWTIDLFDCYKKLLFEPTGKVVTYSSASAVRSAFQQCGMIVRRTTAVGGKSGGTLVMLPSASIDETDGFSLFEEEAEKLAGRAGVPYRDPDFRNSSKEIMQTREQEQRLLFPS